MPRRSAPDALSLAIGGRIRALRQQVGLTLEKLAYESELGSKGHLSDLEKGLVRPTVQTLETLANHLGVGLVDLVNVPESGSRGAVIEATRTLSETRLRALSRELNGNAEQRTRAVGGGDADVVPFDTVEPARGERFRTAIPLVDIRIAAGPFDKRRLATSSAWVRPKLRRSLGAGMFVAKVEGHSMEPLISDGMYALFSTKLSVALDGRVVLVQRGGLSEGDLPGAFTVKKLGPRSAKGVRLIPLNPKYDPIVLDDRDDQDVRIVAELIEVLG